LALRKIGVLETLRLYKALGAVLSGNAAYVDLAELAASVSMIDDVPLPFPVNEAGVESLVERLGDDGIAAVAAADDRPAFEQVVADAGN
jgi:hypothetical protein